MKRAIKNCVVVVISGAVIISGSSTTIGSVKRATASTADMREARATETDARTDSFQIVLPSGTDEIFNFIMDPQELISKTNAAAYGNCSFEDGATLFFKRTDENAREDYSSSSDSLVITNMGTDDVRIVITASISIDSMDGICMTDDMDFTDDTDTSLYLALTDGENIVPIDEEKGASIDTILEGTLGEEEEYHDYHFWLFGTVNKNGDWSQVVEAAPRITVTWSVMKKETEWFEERETWEESEDEEWEIEEFLGPPIMLEESEELGEDGLWEEGILLEEEFPEEEDIDHEAVPFPDEITGNISDFAIKEIYE